MKECCNTCKLKKKLVKFDYSQGGCIHTDYDGYACLALAFEDEVVHMVGHNPELGMCEMYSPREQNKPCEMKRGLIRYNGETDSFELFS